MSIQYLVVSGEEASSLKMTDLSNPFYKIILYKNLGVFVMTSFFLIKITKIETGQIAKHIWYCFLSISWRGG